MTLGRMLVIGLLATRAPRRTEGAGELTTSEGGMLALAAIAALLYYADKRVPR